MGLAGTIPHSLSRRFDLNPPERAKVLAELAEEAGFSLFGVSRAVPAPGGDAYLRWLEAGFDAGMAWMRRAPERRLELDGILPGVRSVIVVGVSYWQGEKKREKIEEGGRGKIARYAWGGDYHDWMLERMRVIEERLLEWGGVQKSYVDTGPILERDYGMLAGLGWQGKSAMLVSPRCGTWFFLGEILTTLELEPSEEAKFRCGSCERCVEACPVGAIVAPGVVDARKCLSYWSIEHKGAIPEEVRPLMKDWLYGCDVCQEVCPWNRFAKESQEEVFRPREGVFFRLRDYLKLSEEGFRHLFFGSPIFRLKRVRFLRNVCVVLGNVGREGDLGALEQVVCEGDALLAEHASWAVGEILRRKK